MVTEMDWAPSKYNASWGKSITGKMLGEGFGANFKLLADNTGNVSWLTFTGCELLAAFKSNVTAGGSNPTFLTDPEACPWPIYHWYKDYAGDDLGSEKEVRLYMSKPVGDKDNECVIMPGTSVSAALVADYKAGFQLNLTEKPEVSVADPSIVSWSDGSFTAHAVGSTDATITYTVSGEKRTMDLHFVSTYFPFVNGYFNPSIWESGSMDPATHTIQTGKYGFAGWKYPAGIDLSSSRYLIAEMEGDNKCAVSFRIFDTDNYWSDPAVVDFGNSKRAVLDLANLKSGDGRKLDASHIYIIGFWSYGSAPFRISKIYLSDSPDGESAIDEIMAPESDGLVDVYNLYGVRVKSQVRTEEAVEGLQPGIYIVGDRKVSVMR